MRPPARLARWLGVGPTDTPRAVEVRRTRAPDLRALLPVAGAPLAVYDDGQDGEVGLVLLACARAGVPVDVRPPAAGVGITLHGVPVAADEAIAWVWGRR